MNFTTDTSRGGTREMLHRSIVTAVGLASLLLHGCSSLQIDVDVYKGPLIQEPEIQLRQYLALAISAKPLLDQLYDLANENCTTTNKNKRPSNGALYKPNCELADGIPIRALYEILRLYDDSIDNEEAPPSTSKSNKGLKTLTNAVIDKLAAPNEVTEKQKAITKLNGNLLFFAQKLLFTANNHDLYRQTSENDAQPATPGNASPVLKATIPILQSLGNSIMVQANDLERQNSRYKSIHESRRDAEHQAIQDAFRLAPSVAFEQIKDLIKALPSTPPTMLSPSDGVALKTSKETDKGNERLQQIEQDRAAVGKKADDYLTQIAPLIAAYRTIIAEPDKSLIGVAPGPADLKAALDDRKVVGFLYSAQTPSDKEKTTSSLFAPLKKWLDAERATSQRTTSSINLVPERRSRLDAASQYLDDEKDRLWANNDSKATFAQAFKAVQTRLREWTGMAENQLAEYRKTVRELENKQKTLKQETAKQVAGQTSRQQVEEANHQAKADADKVLEVLQLVRKEVVSEADDAGLTDPGSVLDLLKRKLLALKPSSGNGKPTNQDIDLARTLVAKLPRLGPPSCSETSGQGRKTSTGSLCNPKNQMDVIDNLTATLRAKRVQALARGAGAEAANLQEAINAAYDQRTSMLYLRPASDYLRSVYTATAFQDGSKPVYRNMLGEWLYYLDPRKKNAGEIKAEQDKQHWQNINQVSLGGGGATNYVLAKDDVGNWYVKAYSSDPESIIKSATSLALYNAGKPINMNLLRRFDLQRQIDDLPNTQDEKRKALSAELSNISSQDGVPLMKVRNRYALRYKQDTERQAKALLAMLETLPEKMETGVGERPPACPFTETQKTLKQLDASHLKTPYDNLNNLVVKFSAKDVAPSIEEVEKGIQQALTSMHLYASQVHKALRQAQDVACDEDRRIIADTIREILRQLLVNAATERKQSIERYEDALTNIADVAAGP